MSQTDAVLHMALTTIRIPTDSSEFLVRLDTMIAAEPIPLGPQPLCEEPNRSSTMVSFAPSDWIDEDGKTRLDAFTVALTSVPMVFIIVMIAVLMAH